MAESSRFRRAWPMLGMALWLAGAAGLAYASRAGHWSPGTAVLAGAGWLLVAMLASRDALRNLFGPVFAYEVLRLGRRRTTFVLRFLYVLLVVGLLALLYGSWMSQTWRYGSTSTVRPSELAGFANTFFEAFASVQLAVVLLLTPAYVAGSIADEKERKTLEFLLATDLRNREIVFGKLAARITNLLMYVLAGLPVLAFLQLFGGIDPELALSAAAATAITVVGLSALSILASTLVRKSRDAIAVSYAVLFLYLAMSTTAGLLGRAAARWYGTLVSVGGTNIDGADLSDGFSAGNLIYEVLLRTNGGKDLSEDTIAGVLRGYAVFWGIASALMIGLAVLRLRAVALAQGHGEPRTASKADARARPEIGDDPILWREAFTGNRRLGCAGWFFRIVVVLALLAGPAFIVYESLVLVRGWRGQTTFAERWEDFRRGMEALVRVATGCLSVLIFFGAALRGAATVSGERDRDTWTSLIAAPLSSATVMRGKFLGAVLGMRFYYGTLLAVWAVGLAVGATHILSLPFAILHLLVYTSAFALLGMLCSVGARTTLVASVRAFGAAFFFAGGFWLAVMLCCVLPINVSGAGGGSGRTLDYAAQSLLAFTPPFMAGFWPMADTQRDNLGPFSMQGSYNVGPVPPAVGFAAWVGFALLLWATVRARLAAAMNRGPKRQRRDRRPSR